MNTRTVCRICKTEGVRLHCITDTHLQEIFERNIRTLVTSDDNKPLLACIECCDKLQHVYQLTNGIEQGENTMMNLDELKINLNDIYQNNTCVESDAEKCVSIEHEQYSEVEVKLKSTTDTPDGISQDNDIELEENHEVVPTIINIKSEALSMNEDDDETNEIITILKSELGEKRGSLADFIQYSDTDDNSLWIQSSVDTCIPLKRESCEERLKGDDVISSDPEDETLVDECPKNGIPQKIVRIILKRCDESSDEKIDVVTIDKKQSVNTPMVRRSLRQIPRKPLVPPPSIASAPRRRRARGPGRHRARVTGPDRHRARVTGPDRHRARVPGPHRHRARVPRPNRHRARVTGPDRHRARVPGPDRHRARGLDRRPARGPGHNRRRTSGPGYNCRPAHGSGADRHRARGPVPDFRRFNTDEDSKIESPEIRRRVVHKDTEKRRRHDHKNLFDNLKWQVPATSFKGGRRVLKIVILREATVLCRRLTQEDLEWKMLKKKQHQLMTKLIKLKGLRTVPSRYRTELLVPV